MLTHSQQDINDLNKLCGMINCYKQGFSIPVQYICHVDIKKMPFNQILEYINYIHKKNEKLITDIPVKLEKTKQKLKQECRERDNLFLLKDYHEFLYQQENKKSKNSLQYTESTLLKNQQVLNEIRKICKQITIEENKQKALNGKIEVLKLSNRNLKKLLMDHQEQEPICSLKKEISDYKIAIINTENDKKKNDGLKKSLREKIKEAIRKLMGNKPKFDQVIEEYQKTLKDTQEKLKIQQEGELYIGFIESMQEQIKVNEASRNLMQKERLECSEIINRLERQIMNYYHKLDDLVSKIDGFNLKSLEEQILSLRELHNNLGKKCDNIKKQSTQNKKDNSSQFHSKKDDIQYNVRNAKLKIKTLNKYIKGYEDCFKKCTEKQEMFLEIQKPLKEIGERFFKENSEKSIKDVIKELTGDKEDISSQKTKLQPK